MIRVGVVGHRYLGNSKTSTFVFDQCLAILKQAQIEHSSVLALSAVAEGADTLFAEAALALDIPLEIIRPFKEYRSDFRTIPARKRYNRLCAATRRETKLTYRNRSNEAYLAAMNWIVEKSDMLVAVWNGHSATGIGGTGDAIQKAMLINRPWIHLNNIDLSVTFHKAERISDAGRW
jgi:hypothetical protein